MHHDSQWSIGRTTRHASFFSSNNNELSIFIATAFMRPKEFVISKRIRKKEPGAVLTPTKLRSLCIWNTWILRGTTGLEFLFPIVGIRGSWLFPVSRGESKYELRMQWRINLYEVVGVQPRVEINRITRDLAGCVILLDSVFFCIFWYFKRKWTIFIQCTLYACVLAINRDALRQWRKGRSKTDSTRGKLKFQIIVSVIDRSTTKTILFGCRWHW